MKNLIILAGILLSASSCCTYYGLADIVNESDILIKPMAADTTVKATYITGTANVSSQILDGDFVSTFGSLSGHRAITTENFCFAYGGYMSIGNYNTNTVQTVRGGEKMYYSGGITGEAAWNIRFEDMEWRIIGVKASYSRETGPYARYRRAISRLPEPQRDEDDYIYWEDECFTNVILTPNDYAINISATSEFVVQLKKAQMGFSGSMGVGQHAFTMMNKAYYTKGRFTLSTMMVYGLQNIYFTGGLTMNLNKQFKMKR